MTWKNRGACLDLDVDLFFPPAGYEGRAQANHAKKVCSECPVRRECLDYALTFDHRSLPGIWGGTTENERRKIHLARLLENPNPTREETRREPRQLRPRQ
jgi:WhiB family redox-sensing transcriptional regulator